MSINKSNYFVLCIRFISTLKVQLNMTFFKFSTFSSSFMLYIVFIIIIIIEEILYIGFRAHFQNSNFVLACLFACLKPAGKMFYLKI